MALIRVLHVVTKMDAAGLETLIMNFYRNIDRSKVQFDFLTHRSEKGYYDDEILSLGGRIYHVPSINPFKHSHYLRALEKFFSEHREYRIVHSHINTYSMYPLRAAMKESVPIRIAHSHAMHGPIDLKMPFREYTKSKLKNYSTHNFACSLMAGNWLFGSTAISKDNFRVINNSIDSSLYTYNQKTEEIVKEEMNLKGKFVIGHIGRFNKPKNHKFLLEIFKLIHDKEATAVLLLVGDGILRQEIEKKALVLGLLESVIFTGVRADIPSLLQSMDVFVFPSLYEGLGIAAIEAQAAGVRTIVSDTIPNEAFVTDLIQKISLNNDAETWAKAILKCKGHKKTNTYESIKASGFDILEQVIELEAFYQKSY
ncbi:glycosyltransferase involved in cell wall biosynthesis [Paenibacillus castaneae]|uniref:glycosyltransferase family 1 protein n=1 Tax=Paenibacillus castaneae TaxID=474957 RepID=UPI001ABB5096|nr:glycosyltransferase family 1 protein [Paenibacillus castaneae]NIK78177.1 glycosyltransferase involved in cell wall biosynthesis [Paenibacillus castaneae]